MLRQYVDKYLSRVDCSPLTTAKLEKISFLLAEKGFAGRDVTNLVIAISQVSIVSCRSFMAQLFVQLLINTDRSRFLKKI